MALEPITRQEKIIAGQDLTPITRMEMFLKNFGGGGGSVPKPLTYDYMPEGYPKKSAQTTTLMEEQEVAFASAGGAGRYGALLTEALDIVEGQTYTVNWDGTEYECVCYTFSSMLVLGNLSIMGTGDNTGEPFIYGDKSFGTLDTAASHTISVKTTAEVITPIAEEFLPNIPADKIPTDAGVTTLHINVTAANWETMAATFTADKTPAEMQRASTTGPIWCVVTFAAGIMAEEAASLGLPPAWTGGVPAFGLIIEHTHEDGGNNKIVFAVEPALADKWNLNLSAFGS